MAWNVTPEQIRRVAQELGLSIFPEFKGRAISFTLGLTERSMRYQRKGFTGRRVWAVCWHGHRDFINRLFQLAPEMRLKSSLKGGVEYNGRHDFLERYQETGDRNIGSVMEPLAYRDACFCNETQEPNLIVQAR